jgi:hypothetical protein
MHAIHNARVQLRATALNNLGVGCVLVAPLVNGTVGDLAQIGAWFALGADLVAMAQVVLGDCDEPTSLWLIVPLAGIGLSAAGWLALWITRRHGRRGKAAAE